MFFRYILPSLISLGIVVLATHFMGNPQGAGKFVTGLVQQYDFDEYDEYKKSQRLSFDPDSHWKPSSRLNIQNQPEINGESALLVDLISGDILYEKDSVSKRKIASLVKIMTATIALEHATLNKKVYITKEMAEIGENTMELEEGEVYTLEELLYGLILHSGNDAAYAVATAVAGDVDTFVTWMNIKAKELGLKNTYFADPSGLDNGSFSTAVDMIRLTRYAMKNPDFRVFVRTLEKEIHGDEHKYLWLHNQTNLLNTYPGVLGVKTGYTEEAGLCLVTYAKNEGEELLGVVLKSDDRKGDMVIMLDHGYEILGVELEHMLADREEDNTTFDLPN